MKARVLILASFSALLLGRGVPAGLNPASPGLPAATNVYGPGTWTNNAASAMCVDCHTANPRPGATHFVAHYDGTALRLTTNTPWEKIDEWGGPGSGRRSKYGVPAPPAVPTMSTFGARGHLICESCHNLVRNDTGGNNLLSNYRNTTDPLVMCEGCHAVQAAGPPAHHPMTGDTVGGDRDVATPHILNTAHASRVRAVPLAGSEVSYPAANAVNCASCHVPHGAPSQTGARILRRGWSIVTTAGLPNIAGKAVNVIYYNNRPDAGDVQGNIKTRATADVVGGIDRQRDIDVAFPGKRLVTNSDPLCDACHIYNY